MPKLTITGAEAKVSGLNAFVSLFRGAVVRNFYKLLEALRNDAQVYPPPPPNSTYKRTYFFQRSWQNRVISETAVMLQNVAPYGHYVMGSMTQGQASHMTHWRLFSMLAQSYLWRAPAEAERAIAEAKAKANL